MENHFKLLVGKQLKDGKKTAVASGIVEKREKKENLLDNLILEMEERIEQEKYKNGNLSEEERKLKTSGEEVLNLALKRINTSEGKSADHMSPEATRESVELPTTLMRTRQKRSLGILCNAGIKKSADSI